MSDLTGQMPEDELLAAEFALGVLSGAERSAAERRLAQDAGFARSVTAWQERLAPWAAEIAEVAPPPAIWDAIVNRLPTAQAQQSGWWQNIAFWRGLSLATGALAAVCLGALIYLGTAPQQTPLIAAIDGGGHHHFVATVDTGRGNIAVQPAAFSADATRVPELWLIPADGKPRPLGLLRADEAVNLRIPREFIGQTVSDAVLAVSLEPPGGSPTGQPTGPVIASGKLTVL
jgi:anti-sigma-K factor RskA